MKTLSLTVDELSEFVEIAFYEIHRRKEQDMAIGFQQYGATASVLRHSNNRDGFCELRDAAYQKASKKAQNVFDEWLESLNEG